MGGGFSRREARITQLSWLESNNPDLFPKTCVVDKKGLIDRSKNIH